MVFETLQDSALHEAVESQYSVAFEIPYGECVCLSRPLTISVGWDALLVRAQHERPGRAEESRRRLAMYDLEDLDHFDRADKMTTSTAVRLPTRSQRTKNNSSQGPSWRKLTEHEVGRIHLNGCLYVLTDDDLDSSHMTS